MARDPLEKETDVFNQMTQTMALNNKIMKDQVASLKSKKKSAPAKAVVKKKAVAGPMPKVTQKKAPAAPGGSSPYKGNAAPGGSTRAGAARTGGTMRPSGTVAKPAAKPAAKSTATKKPDYSNESNASYMARSLGKTVGSVRKSLNSGKKSGNYPAMQNNRNFASQVKPSAPTAAKKPDPSSFASSGAATMLRSLGNALNSINGRGAPAAQPKTSARTTAGIAGKSAKSVNQLFK